MRNPNNPCLFCNIKESGLAKDNDLAYVSYDSYPVTDMHCLIIPKRHVKDYFDLIPRREGDVANPQGGVRSVIPLKQHYKRKS
jgi:hypothetical protein